MFDRAATGPDPVSSAIPTAEADLTQELYKVPSHAAWFGYNAIHDIERKSVPDFFNGRAQSKTPKVMQAVCGVVLLHFQCALRHLPALRDVSHVQSLSQL